MKKAYKLIAALVAIATLALSSGFTVSAQNLPTGTYSEQNGIGFAKRAYINGDGTYTVDLESFVSGEVTQTWEGVPVDVVLVLDVSGSMEEAISSVSSYDPATVTSLTYRNNAGQTGYYYNYEGNYYEVTVDRAWDGILFFGQYHYHLSFEGPNNRTYYINSSGQVVTTRPTNITGDNTNLLNSNVQLYTRQTSTTTKMDALKSAVEAFIDEIAHNDWYEDETDEKPRKDEHGTPTPLGNRISIVKFGLATYNGSTTNASITPGNHFCSVTQDRQGNITGYNNYTTTFSGDNYNVSEVVSSFTLTQDAGNVTALKNAVRGLHAAGATAADYGMNLARLLINSIGADRANSNKTVVFFTDGAPTHQSDFSQTVANAAIGHSNSIKAVTYGEGEDATHPAVFSVGVFKSGDATTQVTTFMNNIATDSSHYMDASGGTAEDLKDIFTAIAHASGGSGNTQVSGTSSVTVDIVSSSFSVPKGFEDNPGSAITVLVAPCRGVTNIGGKDYLTFGQEKTPTEYGLPAITPSISEAGNQVSTTGFDYSANWCGPDATSPTGYHGYKQIIRFVITANDDAVGGPAVETNDADSGIYLEGSNTPLVKFNRPTVKIPVQIWIQKVGLQGDDSAVFTLSRTPFVENFDPETAVWEDDWGTKIVIGPDDYDKTTGMYLKKQVGLSPDYYYRIKEDAWAFGYTYQLGGVQYTFGDNIQNPFVFRNTPNIIKFDEASARNIFNEKVATPPTEGSSD